MTRQKKEIINRIDEIERFIDTDMKMGCGFADAGFYEDLYNERYELEETLARLQHYNNRLEMLNDNRWF